MNKNTLMLAIVCTFISLLSGCGITAGGLQNEPGYAAFEYPHFWEADKEISISIGPTILNFVRAFVDESEDFADLVSDVDGIHIRVYNIDDNVDVISGYINESANKLSRRGWDRLVTVKEEDEHVAVMVKLEDDQVQGVVVLVAEPSEAVFINVIGNIRPESLQPLLARVYDDVPDAVSTL